MIKFKNKENNNFTTFVSKSRGHRPYITGLIMVKNQESYVLNALKSLNKICDQVIVIDTGSTDNTIYNVKKFYPQSKIYQTKWVEDYSYMRNKTLKYIDKGWVLVLDSDEIIKKSCSYDELHNFLGWIDDNTSESRDVVCTIKCFNAGYSCFVRKKCLYKFSKSLYYHGIVHEELLSRNKNLKVIDTDLKIINKGENIDQIKKFNKVQRYTDLLVKQIHLEPNNPRWTSLISPECINKGEVPKAFLKSKFQEFIFKNKINDFSKNNLKIGKYLKYNLFRYILLLTTVDGNIDLALIGAKTGMSLFPWDANFVSLYISIENEKDRLKNYAKLNVIINKLKKYKLNIDKVNEESQGTENALDELVVLLLMKLRHYDEAETILNEITESTYRKDLEPEIKLFKAGC